MYGLFGKIKAQPGQRDTLVAYLLDSANTLSGDDVGCYLYTINLDPNDADAIWVFETWKSQEDHQASLQLPGVQAIIAKARPLIVGMSDRVEFTPVGGQGLSE